MHPFTAAEMGDRFHLEDALKFGLVPVVFASSDKKEAIKAYAALYIKEEVMMEGLTRKIGNFNRFLEAASFSHATVLNITNIARECEVHRKVVESYLTILADLMLAHFLPVFSKRAQRQLISHPKFYFFDCGLFRELRPAGPLDRTEEIDGAALEGLVFQHLLAEISAIEEDAKLFFWRTKSGNEVDFIVYGKAVFVAIEVKNSRTIRPHDLTSLKSFAADYPEAQKILLYRGPERLLKDGVLVLPCEDFLKNLKRFLNPAESRFKHT
jgi:predicted AAA+ superfamily ATPase